MPGNHRCPDCKTIYACCADKCDEHYWLQCTPCEHIEYEFKLSNTKINTLRINIQHKLNEMCILETELAVQLERETYRQNKKLKESWKGT